MGPIYKVVVIATVLIATLATVSARGYGAFGYPMHGSHNFLSFGEPSLFANSRTHYNPFSTPLFRGDSGYGYLNSFGGHGIGFNQFLGGQTFGGHGLGFNQFLGGQSFGGHGVGFNPYLGGQSFIGLRPSFVQYGVGVPKYSGSY